MQEGWLQPGVFHYALLTRLEPSTNYYYIVGSRRSGFTAEKRLRSAPDAAGDEEVRIIALADLGQAQLDGSNEESEQLPSKTTMRLMERDMAAGDFSLIAHFGDIAYAKGHVSQWDRCGAGRPPRCRRAGMACYMCHRGLPRLRPAFTATRR